jgi:hypothetical protein
MGMHLEFPTLTVVVVNIVICVSTERLVILSLQMLSFDILFLARGAASGACSFHGDKGC